MTKIDLNAPAFGQGAQKVSELDSHVNPSEATVIPLAVEPVVVTEVKPVVAASGEEADANSPVPYKRFKKFHDAAKEAQDEATYWRSEAQRLQGEFAKPAPIVVDDLPPQWAKLYGDSEASKDAWKVQKELNADILRQARQEALDSVRLQQQEEVEQVEANVERLDDSFEDLEAEVGRKLTEAEQSSLLDIVDDYTPKDRQGNYAGEILGFDKAWEIYQLKHGAAKSQHIEQRNSVANLTGSPSQGQPSQSEEQNKNWNPFDWNSYKKRI